MRDPPESTSVDISYYGKLDVRRSNLGAIGVDVLDPFVVVVEIICRNTNDLDVALCKIRCAASNLTQLGGAHGGKISRMRE